MMGIDLEKRRVYSEVYEFINLLDREYIDKIPKQLMDFFRENRDKTYSKNINPWMDIQSQNLRRDTILIINVINYKYWADDKEKEILNEIYKRNDKEYLEKYSPENIFKKN
ncbi:MAG: hypothetical protein IJ629_02110 [Clostridia bacterium]|nr:hypothetical protein [Clostridia bacterium]